MLNRAEVKVNLGLLKSTAVIDDHIFRDLVRKMVTEMPFDELSKLMKFTKTDPTTSEVRAKIFDCKTDEHERQHLMLLERQQVILYEAEVFL
jgi:hypothetical protein